MDIDTKIILIMALSYFSYIIDGLILIRVLLSWIRVDRNNAIVRLIYGLTEPILAPVRNLIRKSPIGLGMLDLSPVIAGVLIHLIISMIISAIYRL